MKHKYGLFVILLMLIGTDAISSAQPDETDYQDVTPVLLYGDWDTGTIMLYDPQKGTSVPLIEDELIYNSNTRYFWAPDRGGILRVTIDADTHTFVFSLYPDWHSEPILFEGDYRGYVTPRWSPDGRAVLFETLDPAGFHIVTPDDGQMREVNYPALVDAIWWWETNDTLLTWKLGELSRVDVDTGSSDVLVSGLPWAVRNIVWTPDYDRVVYAWDCIDILTVATATIQTVTCDDFNFRAPLGWLADGETIYYTQNEEIWLYNSVTGEDRSAADPPRQISWNDDVIYHQSGTPYLIHHTTIGRSPDARINMDTGRVDQLLPTLDNPFTRGDFYPSPDGNTNALLLDSPGQLIVFSPGIQSTHVIADNACCLVLWHWLGYREYKNMRFIAVP